VAATRIETLFHNLWFIWKAHQSAIGRQRSALARPVSVCWQCRDFGASTGRLMGVHTPRGSHPSASPAGSSGWLLIRLPLNSTAPVTPSILASRARRCVRAGPKALPGKPERIRPANRPASVAAHVSSPSCVRTHVWPVSRVYVAAGHMPQQAPWLSCNAWDSPPLLTSRGERLGGVVVDGGGWIRYRGEFRFWEGQHA
jgi:hypothetical protein